MEPSRIFLKHRALGYVSNNIPLRVRYIRSRKENLVVTCVGKAFHTYGCTHFTLLAVSGLHPQDITALAADTFHIYTASGNVVYAWRRGTELKHTYIGHNDTVHLLVPFGAHILSIDEKSTLKIWDIKSEELYLELNFDNDIFKVTSVLHPSTYLNKILLGSEQGSLELWNLRTSQKIYTFRGWNSPVNVLEQATAIDVIAVGLSNGKIILHNIKFDKSIMEFTQDWGPVTSLSFRTDNNSVLVSGSSVGAIVFWNLEEQKILNAIEFAHSGAVCGMQCLPNEPLLVTSSSDNSLKMWIFDMPDGSARLLKLREGHSFPPTFVRFYGNDSSNLLSASGDSTLRIYSTVTETFNKSLGVASYNRKISKKLGKKVDDPLKMPPVVEFCSENTREKEWDNIAALHSGIPIVTTWSYHKLKMGEHKLIPQRFLQREFRCSVTYDVTATCIFLTHCGNFVVIGYTSGHVDKFNMQSGKYRGSYGKPSAHSGAVTGVSVDGLNQMTVTGGNDGLIKIWHFKSKDTVPTKQINMHHSVTFFRFHNESSMLAVALENYDIFLMDMDTHAIVRKFVGHTSVITDATFSPDARWLISASMDSTIRTWDVPSAGLIDCFKVDSPCVSLSFSPVGDLLATVHVDHLGVFLWANKTLYSHISLSIISSTDIPTVSLPTSGTEKQVVDKNLDISGVEKAPPPQIRKDLVTLSSLSESRWQNLIYIDVVKQRNKPKSAPKKPKSAPFFLPTLPSLELKFDLNDSLGTGSNVEAAQLSRPHNLTVFGKLLSISKGTNNFDECIERLMSLGPSAIDFELSCLSSEGGGSVPLMLQFVKLICFMLDGNMNFELAQSYLGLFLKKHGSVIASEPLLISYMEKVQKSQLTGWLKLENQLMYCLCIAQFLKS